MDSVGFEDLILAVRRYHDHTSSLLYLHELTEILQKPFCEVKSMVKDLSLSGEILFIEDESITLSDSGSIHAEKILQKHRTLETFFQEILGMDHDTAHEEACTIEHHASDDTIHRLRTFLIHHPNSCVIHHCHKKEEIKLLTDCHEHEQVIIEAVRGCEREKRLIDLGLIPGETIIIRQKLAKTLLIWVKGCDIAISPEIARSVLVRTE